MSIRLTLILMLVSAGAFGADGLDRLFHTPEQRAVLDATRRAAGSAVGAAAGPGLEVSGLVTRSDGQRTIWMNGRSEHGRIERNASRSGVRVQLPEGAVDLKVGQVLDPATGKVQEIYRRPPKPAAAPSNSSREESKAGATKPPTSAHDDDDGDNAELPARQ